MTTAAGLHVKIGAEHYTGLRRGGQLQSTNLRWAVLSKRKRALLALSSVIIVLLKHEERPSTRCGCFFPALERSWTGQGVEIGPNPADTITRGCNPLWE